MEKMGSANLMAAASMSSCSRDIFPAGRLAGSGRERNLANGRLWLTAATEGLWEVCKRKRRVNR